MVQVGRRAGRTLVGKEATAAESVASSWYVTRPSAPWLSGATWLGLGLGLALGLGLGLRLTVRVRLRVRVRVSGRPVSSSRP